jgi:IstB-like ATP binding protein
MVLRHDLSLATLRVGPASQAPGHEMMAAAILDRLLHFSHVFLISGPSYRMKDKGATVDQPTPTADATV